MRNLEYAQLKPVVKQLSMDQGKVDWFKMVWQKKANPRHAFLLTLALMQKKATTAN